VERAREPVRRERRRPRRGGGERIELLTDALDPPPKAAALERVDDVWRSLNGKRVLEIVKSDAQAACAACAARA